MKTEILFITKFKQYVNYQRPCSCANSLESSSYNEMQIIQMVIIEVHSWKRIALPNVENCQQLLNEHLIAGWNH